MSLTELSNIIAIVFVVLLLKTAIDPKAAMNEIRPERYRWYMIYRRLSGPLFALMALSAGMSYLPAFAAQAGFLRAASFLPFIAVIGLAAAVEGETVPDQGRRQPRLIRTGRGPA